MPVITVTMGSGRITSDQKKEMIQKFTQEGARIARLPEQAFTILIHELSPEAIGVAGKTLTELHGASGS